MSEDEDGDRETIQTVNAVDLNALIQQAVQQAILEQGNMQCHSRFTTGPGPGPVASTPIQQNQIQSTNGGDTLARSQPQLQTSNKEIANLLPEFNGANEELNAVGWLKRVDAIQCAYGLSDARLQLIVVNKLTGSARKWYHSKVEHITMDWTRLKQEMKSHFTTTSDFVTLRRKFEARLWKWEEKFSEYFHEKVSLGNMASVSNEEIVEYLIEGIPDENIQNNAKMKEFTSLEELLRSMCNVKLTKPSSGASRPLPTLPKSYAEGAVHPRRSESSSRAGAASRLVKRCYNCYSNKHKANNCPQPKRERGSCFGCGKMDHVVKDCPDRAKKSSGTPTHSTSHVIESTSSAATPYLVPIQVSFYNSDGCKCVYNISALLDTGSPISLLKQR